MSSDERTSGAESHGRAAEQVDRLVTDDRRSRELVESLDGDGSGADQLAAMIAPPHDPTDIDAMRGTQRPETAPEPDPEGHDLRGKPAAMSAQAAAKAEQADRSASESQKPPWPTMHPANDYDGGRPTPDNDGDDDHARRMHEQLRIANNEHSTEQR